MRTQQQLVMGRPDERSPKSQPATSGVKTILLHILDDEFHDQRIEAALSLARACAAHVSCLHVTAIEAHVAMDSFSGVLVMNDILKTLDEHDAALQLKVEERFGREDVSWDYEQVTGNVTSAVISRAALTDLLITARQSPSREFLGPTAGFLGDLLQRSRTPLLVPASGGACFDPAGAALIAWNGSFEAANAVRGSLELLRLASEVRVLEVTEEKQEASAFPGTKLLTYLSRQGIHAELMVEASPTGGLGHDVIAGMIISQARGVRAAYIVMGGYSHTRIGEYLFGGVTRTLLKDCPVALLIAH